MVQNIPVAFIILKKQMRTSGLNIAISTIPEREKEIIFYKNMPVWCMSYQGKVSSIMEEKEVTSIYSFLKNALRASDVKIPFRGPKRFLEGDFEYTFDFVGDYSYFVGRESVRKQGVEVFFQDIMGSLIK